MQQATFNKSITESGKNKLIRRHRIVFFKLVGCCIQITNFWPGICYLLYLSSKSMCGFCGSDFDECSVYGTCSQSCTNTEGAYTCSCVEGYLSQPDNRSCKAKNGKYTSRQQQDWVYTSLTDTVGDVVFFFLLLTVSYVCVAFQCR